MNFNEDDELDYEEDDLENDFGSKIASEDETNENSNILGSDDQYVQINCSEEEENFMERIATGSEHTEIQNNQKTDEEIHNADVEKTEKPLDLEKPPSGIQEYPEDNNNKSNSSNSTNNFCNSNDNDNINYTTTNKTFKKKKWPFQRRLKMQKLPTDILTLSSWLPKWNISSTYDFLNLPKESVYNKPILNLSQAFYSNPYSQFPLLGLSASHLGQNLPQLMQMGDRRLRHENMKPKAIARNKSTRNMQNFNARIGGFADNHQICGTKKNFKNRTLHHQNDKSVDPDGVNYFGRNKNNLLNGLCNPLKDDEKELVKLKKEARLKRFMNDDIVRKEKKSIGSTENKTKENLNLGAEYFKKLEEQKFTREKLLSLKEHQRKNSCFDADKSVSVEKPNINKELLLKKRNPFDENLKKSSCFLMNMIKQEKVKQEGFRTEPLSPQGLSVVKSEMNPHVKFVRTISKSFDELAVRKPEIKVLKNKEESFQSNTGLTFPNVAAHRISSSRTIDLPTQAEIQLTGCIVKVFNIPPSTTTNDILELCRPIGVVKEIKLNLPKENSVAIRFGEPACAENFFSVYHGQKMNNYFLNVIVI